jgi:hypothetical protein
MFLGIGYLDGDRIPEIVKDLLDFFKSSVIDANEPEKGEGYV